MRILRRCWHGEELFKIAAGYDRIHGLKIIAVGLLLSLGDRLGFFCDGLHIEDDGHFGFPCVRVSAGIGNEQLHLFVPSCCDDCCVWNTCIDQELNSSRSHALLVCAIKRFAFLSEMLFITMVSVFRYQRKGTGGASCSLTLKKRLSIWSLLLAFQLLPREEKLSSVRQERKRGALNMWLSNATCSEFLGVCQAVCAGRQQLKRAMENIFHAVKPSSSPSISSMK